jgi:hypothetical protein
MAVVVAAVLAPGGCGGSGTEPIDFGISFNTLRDHGDTSDGYYVCNIDLQVIATGDRGAGASFRPIEYTLRLSNGQSVNRMLDAATTVEFLGSDQIFAGESLITGTWLFWWDTSNMQRFSLTLDIAWQGLDGSPSGSRQVAFTCV